MNRSMLLLFAGCASTRPEVVWYAVDGPSSASHGPVHDWEPMTPPRLGSTRTIHHVEHELLHRVLPVRPPDVVGEHRCMATISIAATGVPEDVAVSSCDERLYDPVRTAVLQWRFAPYLDGLRTETTVALTFRP